ncbi:hypothetical protein, partial [Paraburkholderia domus]|uniref:hypothetical protein n=1 Tax=Paraburkholderia domus TaxID=2793075 RepID=UPI001B8AF504
MGTFRFIYRVVSAGAQQLERGTFRGYVEVVCRWRWGSAQIWRRQVDGGVANAYARDEMTGRWSWGY